ncbi:DUF1206 domain-containing protein [Nocardioides antri]|uniref:DUF1206 domain-containing protein n=1 Tax=Nocardioides antri TaxID=2607659 RepID=A0A5B1M7T5_9ACTN|nr:DUF1206 domain-containing protein [Nocardioides antri]KAA1429345.1 DUF1206 domain-containing protein [Nocardioides antri]
MTTQDAAGTAAEDKAQQARNNPALEWLAKIGTAIYGVTYVVVGWLALQIAFGEPAGRASGQGALREMSQQPFGETILWIACIGFVALVVWKICEAVAGHDEEDGRKLVAARAMSAGKAVVFALLAVLAFQTVTGSSSGGSSEDGYTATIMKMPLGPVLVVAVGIAIIGYGVYSAYKGLTDKWRKSLESGGRTGDIGTAITVLARVGYSSRGLAFAVIGGLFVWAGFTHDADKSGGLDQALLTLRDAPFGKALLVAVAIGLAAYGVYNVAKAWYLKQR